MYTCGCETLSHDEMAAGQNPVPLHPPPLLQIPQRPPAPPAPQPLAPQPLLVPFRPPPQPPGQQPPAPQAFRPPAPAPPPDPDPEGNIGMLLDPNWFRVIIMKCTSNVHEGTASVTLDHWQGTWKFLPNEFVASARHASSGLQIKQLILKQHHISQLPTNFAALQTGLSTSLSTLDLSHNRFSVLPSVVCELGELKELHLNHNQISYIPEQISNLTKLESLYLQVNALESLPVCVCHLPALRSLNAEDNLIEVVPPEICQLKQLKTLYLKSNRLAHFPQRITELPNLEELHLSNNRLTDIHLDGLKSLRQLHLAHNNLRFLPFSIVNINLQGLTVSYNPLKFPPMSACRKGVEAIKAYMMEKYRNGKGRCTYPCVVGDNPYYDSDEEDKIEYEDMTY